MRQYDMLDPNLHWILSFYRTSEIGGALFFGEIARTLRPSPIQQDMTRHFADEANHARYWTDCLAQLGAEPLKLDATYQDQYLAAAGMPTNLMEILAITQVFEKRVVSQYALHHRSRATPPAVRATLAAIMADERWHIAWIRDALAGMEGQFGKSHIDSTIARFTAADREVYRKVTTEHGERLGAIRLAPR
jgi:bacterioferritin (cytochrome b1)